MLGLFMIKKNINCFEEKNCINSTQNKYSNLIIVLINKIK